MSPISTGGLSDYILGGIKMKLSEMPRDKRVLVQGGSGTGKTTIIGTLCKLVPTLLVTSDKEGLETLATMGIDPEVVYLDDWMNCWDKYAEIVKAIPNFKALAIDDFGATQVVARNKIERMPRGYKEEQDRDFRTTVRRELMRGERTMEMRDWGKMWVAMENFLSAVLTLPPTIKLVTVLESPDDDPRTGKMRLYPNLQGAIRHSLPARFSLVAEAFLAEHKEKLYYCLSSKPHPKVATKDRYGHGRTWIDPNMADVLAYINGKGGEENEVEKAIGTGL